MILFLYNVDTLDTCMKGFGSEKIIFDKMTVVRTKKIFPNRDFDKMTSMRENLDYFSNISSDI